jgi:hypothetical protein
MCLTYSEALFHIALLDTKEPTEHNIYPDLEIDSKTVRYFCCKDGRDLKDRIIKRGKLYCVI